MKIFWPAPNFCSFPDFVLEESVWHAFNLWGHWKACRAASKQLLTKKGKSKTCWFIIIMFFIYIVSSVTHNLNLKMWKGNECAAGKNCSNLAFQTAHVCQMRQPPPKKYTPTSLIDHQPPLPEKNFSDLPLKFKTSKFQLPPNPGGCTLCCTEKVPLFASSRCRPQFLQ